MANKSKIYVGNLPPDSTVKDIENLFGGFGKIIDIDIKNRNGPPFAFIQFDDIRDAEDAVRERDDYDLDGFSLRVEFPREIKHKIEYPRRNNYETSSIVPHFNSNDMYMPFDYCHYQNHDTYKYYGNYRPDFYSNYTYPNRLSRPLHNTEFRVYLSKLPLYLNWQEVKDFMQRYGEVSYAKVYENGTGICDFMCKEDYKYVLTHLSKIKFKSRSGQTSYIKVEDYRSKRRGYFENTSRHKSRETRSRSRSHRRSKSSRAGKYSSSSERSFKRDLSQSKY